MQLPSKQSIKVRFFVGRPQEVLKGEEVYLPIVLTSYKNRNELYFAGVAQLAVQPPCKRQVAGSIPVTSSLSKILNLDVVIEL